jgi:hypothetical protein
MGLSMYGDPDALDQLAQRLQTKALDIREYVDVHVRQGRAAHWVSVAAEACRDRIAKDGADADRAGAKLEDAAVALRVHAQRVRELIALIVHYERAATAWFEFQVRALANTVEQAIDSADRVVKDLVRDLVNDPPWRTWPFGPLNLPASGDLQWLEVGAFMREQGII